MTSNKTSIDDIYIDEGCTVTILVNGLRRQISFGRYVVKGVCGNVVKPVISNDGEYAMFESRLLLEDSNQPKGLWVNAVYVYTSSQNMVFKAYDYGGSTVEKLAFDKDNNLLISLPTKDGIKNVKTILYNDFSVEFNEEDKRILRLVKSQPEVNEWLGKNANREVEIKSVNDDVVLVRVYEYFATDQHTETFDWYEYNRLTGNIKVIK